MHPLVAGTLSTESINNGLKTFCESFDKINPLSQMLRRMAGFNTPDLKVVFRHQAAHPCVCAFMTNAVDMQRTRRELFIWKEGKSKEEPLDICSPLYEPLQ